MTDKKREKDSPDGQPSEDPVYHAPVLCKTAVDELVTDADGTYVDGTLGGGGHAAALLDRLGERAAVFGIDQDEDAIDFGSRRLAREIELGRLCVIRGNFGELRDVLRARDVDAIDGLLLDLGVSSHQLDTPSRGFSHTREGRLDMRMHRAEGSTGDTPAARTAGALIETASEGELADLFFRYGEEPRARRIAAAIVAARPIETTTELAAIVRRAVPRDAEARSLARVFQALRIAVNRELEALEAALNAATSLVRPGGRLVVIAYHSLEDRLVKRFMRSGSPDGVVRRDVYGNALSPWRAAGRVVKPSDDEVAANPRARSARLRVAERTDLPTASRGTPRSSGPAPG